MNLTEKELNYILSECIKYMLNENNIDEEPTNVTTNSKFNNLTTQVKNAVQKPLQNFKKNWKNSKGGLGKAGSVIKSAFQAVPGGAMYGLSKAAKFGLGLSKTAPTSFLGNLVQFAPHVMAGIGIAQLGAAVARMYQKYNKEIPNNRLQAFKCGVNAVPEYENAAELCKTIQSNFNQACDIYNEFADEKNWPKKNISWNVLKNEVNGSTFTLSKGALKGAKGEVTTDTDFNNLNIGINEANEINVQQAITPGELKKIFEKCSNGDEAYNFVKQVAQAYAEAYQLYYTWRSYLKGIMLKHKGITWDMLKSGNLPGVANFLKRSTDNINVNDLSQKNYITLSIFNKNYSITDKYNNPINFIIFKGDDKRLYCLNYKDLNQSTINSHISNGVQNFSLPKKQANTNKNTMIYNDNGSDRKMFILTADDIIEMQPIQGAQQQQPTQQQPTQQQPTQQQPTQQQQPQGKQGTTQQQQTNNPYGNNPYGGGWTTSY